MRTHCNAWLLALAGTACASAAPGAGDGEIHAWAMRERLGRVEVGQTLEQAHAILGRDPVRKPGHPDEPFPSPLRELALSTPAGEEVHVEIYVVASRPAAGCPDVHTEDAPVAFVDGRLAGKSWEFVEEHWRGWGGSLEELRDAQDRHSCPYPRPDVQR